MQIYEYKKRVTVRVAQVYQYIVSYLFLKIPDIPDTPNVCIDYSTYVTSNRNNATNKKFYLLIIKISTTKCSRNIKFGVSILKLHIY